MLNPFIYSLRNRDMKGALRNILSGRLWSQWWAWSSLLASLLPSFLHSSFLCQGNFTCLSSLHSLLVAFPVCFTLLLIFSILGRLLTKFVHFFSLLCKYLTCLYCHYQVFFIIQVCSFSSL
jgi:hypothetical protein